MYSASSFETSFKSFDYLFKASMEYDVRKNLVYSQNILSFSFSFSFFFSFFLSIFKLLHFALFFYG